MVSCDTCGAEVTNVLNHYARTDSMTHRRPRRVCVDCHPLFVASSEAVTDGGTCTDTCPDCAGHTINGQGLYSCLHCEWVGQL